MESGIRVPTGSAAAGDRGLTTLTGAAQLAAVWAAAGGTAGGVLLAALLLAGRLHPGGSATAALLLAVTGGCLGLIHGAVLGRLSRGEEPAAGYLQRVVGVLIAATAVAGAAALSLWLTTSAVVARSGRLWGWIALLAGAAVATAIAFTATRLGWLALERAWGEWRERRLGSLLVVGAFAVLSTVFLALEPALPGGRGGLTTVGWLLVAALATLWIATPLIVVTLRTAFRRRAR